MKHFKNFKNIKLAGEFLSKDEIQKIFVISDENFLESFHNYELLSIEVDDKQLFPTFQFHKDLLNIGFSKIVKELKNCMYSETVIEFLFTEHDWLEYDTGSILPIDAVRNGYKEEVIVYGSCNDIVEFLMDFDDPDKALFELYKHG